MNHFTVEFDMHDPDSLREYLRDHFRYHTMNYWNNSTSYAHCVKIARLPLTDEQRTRAYEMLEVPLVFEDINRIINDWEAEQDFKWQIGFNGRSSGYLVLYQGGRGPDGRIFSNPGRSIDQDVDFEDWDLDELQSRAEIVSSFDELCDAILDNFLYTLDNYAVKERTIMVPKTVKVLEAL